MSNAKTYDKYIALNPQGVPVIKGTPFKIVFLLQEKSAWGWDLEEMHRNHPHLAREQIQAAMDYYADHCEEIDYEISKSLEEYEKMRREAGPSELVKKLREKGLLSILQEN